MLVHIVDPSAYTPPYDDALCRALARAGAEVELFTSRYRYAPLPDPSGYHRHEHFYRLAHGQRRDGHRSRGIRALKLAEHVPDMLGYRRLARHADVVHFQWLPVQPLDLHLLPRARARPASPGPGGTASPARARVPGLGYVSSAMHRARTRTHTVHRGREHSAAVRAGAFSGAARDDCTIHAPRLVITAHDILPREPRPWQRRAQARLYERFDAIVVHSEHGRRRLIEEVSVDPARLHVIPHGALQALPDAADAADAAGEAGAAAGAGGGLPPELHAGGTQPVVLFFGLLRPYKGLDVLIDAWRELHAAGDLAAAELWIAGMARMDTSALRAAAPPSVRFLERFVVAGEIAQLLARASLVVLPYRDIDASGAAFTALAAGVPLLLSDAGSFPELAATGAARCVPVGDARSLASALSELLQAPATLERMARAARRAASPEGAYGWERIARQTLDLYRSLLA